MKPWLILAAVLALAGSFAGGAWKGERAADLRWQAKVAKERAAAEKERAAAIELARIKETQWQEKVDDTVRKHEKSMAAVRRNLDLALDGLRDRPNRAPGVSETPRAACAGGTGAELSGPDAGFLAREAARADGIRAGLEACYAVIDGVRR